jgi:hypothetical protein
MSLHLFHFDNFLHYFQGNIAHATDLVISKVVNFWRNSNVKIFGTNVTEFSIRPEKIVFTTVSRKAWGRKGKTRGGEKRVSRKA